jgi:hypothetical protein
MQSLNMSKLMTTVNYLEVGPKYDLPNLNVHYACKLHRTPINASGDKVRVTDSSELITPHDIVEPLPSTFILHSSRYANALSVGDFAQVVIRFAHHS